MDALASLSRSFLIPLWWNSCKVHIFKNTSPHPFSLLHFKTLGTILYVLKTLAPYFWFSFYPKACHYPKTIQYYSTHRAFSTDFLFHLFWPPSPTAIYELTWTQYSQVSPPKMIITIMKSWASNIQGVHIFI